jgi:hypothetical protein
MAYAMGLLIVKPAARNKELFRLCKDKFPEHPLFKNDDPKGAFRVALHRARKAARSR